MSVNRKPIMRGLITAAGAALAFVGMRRIMRMRQSRRHQPQDQMDWTRQQEHGEGMQMGWEERSQESQGQPVGMRVEGTRDQPQDQPEKLEFDRPIPATGVMAGTMAIDELIDIDETTAPTEPAASAESMEALRRAAQPEEQPVGIEDQAEPLAQYLLAFNDLIEQLRTRRKDAGTISNGRSLTPEDRSSFQDTLNRLEAQIPDYGEGNLEEGSLQERIYRLTVKVRDTLQNLDYNDDDLFRLNREFRTEACKILAEMMPSGAGAMTDLDQVRLIYECK